jgi:agmatinase
MSFLDVPGSLDKSKVCILPVPYEATTTYLKGTRKGPGAIIASSRNVELYDEELGDEPYRIGIHTLKEFRKGFDTPQGMIKALASKTRDLFALGKLVITLGGEHTVTLGPVAGLEEVEKDISVLILDAHADLRDSYEGSKYSHACVSRRLIVNHRIVQVGIRSFSQEEADFIKEKKLKLFYAKDIIEGEGWMKEALSRLSDKVYLSFDLDFLDPSIMPAVGTPEPGGLGWYKTLKFLRLVAEEKKILGMDVVELCPGARDIPSAFTAAKLIYKLIAYLS